MSILEDAGAAVQSRHVEYGESTSHHAITAAFWGAYLGRSLTSTEVAVMMILEKVARQRNDASHRDNYVDMAGYAAVAAHNAGLE